MSFLFLIFASLQASAKISTLSDCRIQGWDTSRVRTDHALTIQQSADGCSARFEIRPTEEMISEGRRAEIKDPAILYREATVWYKFETFIPAELKGAGTTRLVLAQWHDQKNFGKSVQRPPLTLRLQNGKLIFPLFNQEIYDRDGADSTGLNLGSVPVRWNQWMKIEVHARWQADDFGLIDIFVDGKLVRRYHGAVGYPDDEFAPYFKLGIYTVHGFDRPAVVLHRNVERTVRNSGLTPAFEAAHRR